MLVSLVSACHANTIHWFPFVVAGLQFQKTHVLATAGFRKSKKAMSLAMTETPYRNIQSISFNLPHHNSSGKEQDTGSSCVVVMPSEARHWT